jgi:hypothetical protein
VEVRRYFETCCTGEPASSNDHRRAASAAGCTVHKTATVLNKLPKSQHGWVPLPSRQARSSSGRFFHVLLNTQGAVKFRFIQNVP